MSSRTSGEAAFFELNASALTRRARRADLSRRERSGRTQLPPLGGLVVAAGAEAAGRDGFGMWM